MDTGGLVSDSVTNKPVHDRLSEDDVDGGYPLDVYPHNGAGGLPRRDLAAGDQRLDVVLQQTADDEELVTRLHGRAKETGRSDVEHALSVMSKTTVPVMGQA